MTNHITETVLILNHSGGLVFEGQAQLTNIETDTESGCLIADCKLEKGLTVKLWQIDNKWQGWV